LWIATLYTDYTDCLIGKLRLAASGLSFNYDVILLMKNLY